MCICHDKGGMCMHAIPCCDLTYVQYINADGSIDFEIYNKAKENVQKSD